MRVLIDTNAYVELGKRNTHIRTILEAAHEIIVSTIVLGELYSGFSLGSKKEQNIREIEEFLGQPGVIVVAPSKDVAERYGEVFRILKKNGTPIPTNDIWIAATALETASRILSFDTHFALVPGIFSVL